MRSHSRLLYAIHRAGNKEALRAAIITVVWYGCLELWFSAWWSALLLLLVVVGTLVLLGAMLLLEYQDAQTRQEEETEPFSEMGNRTSSHA